ncbi:MAG: HEAT repeat domain-containing protein [Planctomycetaceae bacterium]|nr:HEAT repeat domain-containing protein [Planctomycetaceae bacterium]
MRRLRMLLPLMLLILGTVVASAQDEANKLATILNDPNASLYAKTLACKQAAQTATKESVPPLAAVLLDEALSHPARIALQQIPGPEATAALCNALPDAKGDVLIGIIGTLGERQDPAAVAQLEAFLDPDDKQIVYATAVALGKIASDDALVALQKRFEAADIDKKALLVDGLLACAERMIADDKAKEAIRVYEQIQIQRDLPVVLRCGAIRGSMLILGPRFGKEVPNEETNVNMGISLVAIEDGEFLAVLEATRDLTSANLTPGLLGMLSRLDADYQKLLLDLLDCRGDAAAIPAVLAMAKDNNAAAQTAAIRALAGMPNDEVITFLLATATGDNAANATAAADALSRMQSPGLEQKIIEQLKTVNGKSCIPLVQVCGLRKISDVTPVLLPLLSDADNDVRLAVIAALGNTVSGENIEVLVAHVLKPASETEFEAVKASLRVVCFRTVDPDATAAKLEAVYGDASLQAKCALIELFGALGGKVAITAVQQAIANPAVQIQDTATRVLGEWPDPDAAPVLLSVLRSEADERFKIRALRGYIRIVRQMDTSNEHRFNMCMEALALAQRDEEKTLLVDALGRITTAASLAKLSEFIDQPTFAEQASLMAISVGKALRTQLPDDVTAVMQKIIATTQNADTRRQAEEVLN